MSRAAEQAQARQLLRAGRQLLLAGEWTYDRRHARQLLWEAQDGICACCDRLLLSRYRFPLSGDQDTLDHVWPQGFGGPDKLGNLVLLTRNCNNRKGGRWPTEQDVVMLAAVNRVLGWPTPRIPFLRAA